MDNLIRIIEWNIDNKKAKGDEFEKQINILLSDSNADIIVLTEVCSKHKDILEGILVNSKNNIEYVINEISKKEYIVMLVSKNKISKIEYLKYDINEHTHLSRVGAKFLFRNQDNWVKIIGIRLHTQCTNEFKNQLKQFIEEIRINKPSIIIGDLNWRTTIGKSLEQILGSVNERKQESKKYSKIIYEEILNGKGNTPLEEKIKELEETEMKLCELLNYINDDCDFRICPCKEISKLGYSAKTIIRHKSNYSSPDRVIWDDKKIECCEVKYEPNLSDGEDFPDGWPSDHSMIIVDVRVREC